MIKFKLKDKEIEPTFMEKVKKKINQISDKIKNRDIDKIEKEMNEKGYTFDEFIDKVGL